MQNLVIPTGSLATTLLLLTGCPAADPDPEPAPDAPPPEAPAEPDRAMEPLEVGDDEVRSADGEVLLEIGDVPGDVRVDDETEFGAAMRFTEASLSPDEGWLALATSGAAHGAGWLVEAGSRDPRAAAFQYGGRILIGPWSDDGRWVVFVHEGPAGDRTLTVADRERLGDTVDESGRPVRVADHDDRAPEERIHEGESWRDGELRFRIGEERWVYDPEAGEVREEG